MPSPIPKPAATRQRRNRSTTTALLEAPPVDRVELPEEIAWHPRTLAWWTTIWDSPMSAEWVDADVPGLIAMARLVDAFWSGEGDLARLAGEIRMQNREYGLSPLSRRQLQWEIRRLTAPVASTQRSRRGDPRLRVLGA